MHLWEVNHPYYCREDCYNSNGNNSMETVRKFDSWSEFTDEFGDPEENANDFLLFRWDWSETDPETEESTFTGDIDYRNGTLYLFFMVQGKGYHSTWIVDVYREDEQQVIEFLRGYWEHLKLLWMPISG